jgi:hypothetical protein
MGDQTLLEKWRREENMPFEGWDFSYLDGRMLDNPPPWSYMDRAKKLMQQSTTTIDIDTGGGEKLLDMRDHWSERMFASEGYPPNIKLAAERLSPLGVSVIPMNSSDFTQMPFADNTFDLILNRHGAFNCDELARVLVSGGTFLTKQVHGMWAHDLLAVFGTKPQWPDASPEKYIPWLEQVGMSIVDVQDWNSNLEYTDVGAIVFHLTAVPWLVPNFAVNTYAKQLLGLQARLDSGERLVFEARTYMIEAQNA